MLNRLFIVVGVLAIVVIMTAFLAPFFVDWSQYRGRMEMLAAQAMGTDVQISGNINVTLLPQPQLHFEDVILGPKASPMARIASVDAQFSLMDFMRDRYAVTRLVLSGPEINLVIDKDGHVTAPLQLKQAVSASNVSVANADIENGVIRLTDARVGITREATDFTGTLQIAGLRGPFSLQGNANYAGTRYDGRFNTSPMNAAGALQMAAFLRPVGGTSSFGIDGVLETGERLNFTGNMVARQAPGAATSANDVRGDMVITSKVVANTDQILLSDYVILPDENRAATRLTGAATVQLGANSAFDAVLSGGVVALNPRDALGDEAAGPYELVRLLTELPAPIIPGMAGRIGIDVSELDLRAVALRDLRIEAQSDGERWSIGSMTARLPGNTQLSLVGALRAENGRPAFDGAMTLDSARLDHLALQWRKAGADNPLFNMPGSLSGRVALKGDVLSLDNGQFVLDGVSSAIAVRVNSGAQKRLTVSAQIGALDAQRSAALQALLPDIAGDHAVAASFPEGDFDLSVKTANLFGLETEDLAAKGNWGPGELTFDWLSAADMGGARFDMSGRLEGSLKAPVLAGKGQLSLKADADKDALAIVLSALKAPAGLKNLAASVVPAELSFDLGAPGEANGQTLGLRGRIGVADMTANMHFSDGVFRLASAPVRAEVTLQSGQVLAFADQFGLGPVALVPDDGAITVSLIADGTLSNSLETDLSIEGSGDKLRFFGNAVVNDLDLLRGKGKLEFALSDMAPMAQALGAEAIGYGPVSGTADLSFTNGSMLNLTNLNAEADGILLSGDIGRSLEGGNMLYTGALRASAVELGMLAGLAGGPASLVSLGAFWPDGPFAFADDGRHSRGRVRVETPFMRLNGRDVASDAGFDLAWDETNVRIRGLNAQIGGGTLGLEMGLCCSSAVSDRQMSGRLTLKNVDVDAVMPKKVGAVLGGKLEGGLTFTATGDSYAAMLGNLTGEGSFGLAGFSISGFDPAAFERVANENILELQPDELTDIVRKALADGAFKSPQVGGVFSVAGGVVRIANLAAEGEIARLFGGGSLDLDDLALEGNWTLTPTAVGASGTSQVTALLSGTLLEPDYQLDLAQMIDAVKVRAYELEVDRLEKLRAEQEKRSREAAETRARLMEEQSRQQALDAATKAEAEAETLRQENRQRAFRELMNELGESQDPLVSPDGTENGNAPIDLFQEQEPVTDPFGLPAPNFENNNGSRF